MSNSYEVDAFGSNVGMMMAISHGIYIYIYIYEKGVK